MFWSKKVRCPITFEDKQWVEESLTWMVNVFGKDKLLEKKTVLPTKQQFGKELNGSRGDAEYLLEYLLNIMDIEGKDIRLSYYQNPRQIEFSEGLTTVRGDYDLSLGRYVEYDDGRIEILIEEELLRNPISLIATLGHELAHVKLLSDNLIDENDEYLTDLTVIFFVLGIFNANTALTKLNTWSGVSHAGWQISGGEGYIPYKVQAYTMAVISKYKGETSSDWSDYLEKGIKKEFDKSLKYIDQNIDLINFK